MSDPRELLDAYARESGAITRDDGIRREQCARRAFAAMRAVLDLHKPMHDVLPECAHCYEHGEVVNTSWPCPTVQAIIRELEGK